MNGFAAAVEEAVMAWFLVTVAVQEEDEPATTANDMLGTPEREREREREKSKERIEGNE
jgi:hypothetical protein